VVFGLGRKSPDELIGIWRSDPRDEAGVRSFGDVSMDFRPDGTLVYTVHEQSKDQIMLLTYRANSGWLETDQASMPRRQRNKYSINNGLLAVEYDGQVVRFIRAATESSH
jgi:hypothetical protein